MRLPHRPGQRDCQRSHPHRREQCSKPSGSRGFAQQVALTTIQLPGTLYFTFGPFGGLLGPSVDSMGISSSVAGPNCWQLPFGMQRRVVRFGCLASWHESHCHCSLTKKDISAMFADHSGNTRKHHAKCCALLCRSHGPSFACGKFNLYSPLNLSSHRVKWLTSFCFLLRTQENGSE